MSFIIIKHNNTVNSIVNSITLLVLVLKKYIYQNKYNENIQIMYKFICIIAFYKH